MCLVGSLSQKYCAEFLINIVCQCYILLGTVASGYVQFNGREFQRPSDSSN